MTSYLGVDIGGTAIKWVLIDAAYRVKDSGQLPTPRAGPASVVDSIAGLWRARSGPIDGVGIAVPGHLDRPTGRVTVVPNLAGDWPDFPFGPALAEVTGSPVELINDARAFATAELGVGSARNLRRVVFATVGTGLGGAIALDGTIQRDRCDAVGELGHSTVVLGGVRCGCGNQGCAEAYVGVRALERALGRPIGEVRDAILAGLPEARSALELSCTAFAAAVVDTAILIRAEAVVIGGGLGTRWPEYAAAVTAGLRRRHNLVADVSVRVSQLGDHSGAIGAAVAVAARDDVPQDRQDHNQQKERA